MRARLRAKISASTGPALAAVMGAWSFMLKLAPRGACYSGPKQIGTEGIINLARAPCTRKSLLSTYWGPRRAGQSIDNAIISAIGGAVARLESYRAAHVRKLVNSCWPRSASALRCSIGLVDRGRSGFCVLDQCRR